MLKLGTKTLSSSYSKCNNHNILLTVRIIVLMCNIWYQILECIIDVLGMVFSFHLSVYGVGCSAGTIVVYWTSSCFSA